MIPLNTIQCRDCLEGMREIPYKSVDLIVTSPPYNICVEYNGSDEYTLKKQKYINPQSDVRSDSEYVAWLNDVLKESLRVSRYVCWNVQWLKSTRTHIASIHNTFDANLKEVFIWKKQCAASINARSGGLCKGWEYVFMLGENNLCTFNYNDFPSNGYVPNIKTWTEKDNANEDHHAMFPLVLPSYFISHFSKVGDTIMDPFNGSGTTSVAAIRAGRNFIGFEKEQSYFGAANIRIKKAQEQGKIGTWFE